MVDRELLDPRQAAAGGFEVDHCLADRLVEAAVQADPVVEHPLGYGCIGAGLEFQVQDRARVGLRQQHHRIGMERSAAQLAIEQLPGTAASGRLCFRDAAEHPAANAGGVPGHQLFAEVIDHWPKKKHQLRERVRPLL